MIGDVRDRHRSLVRIGLIVWALVSIGRVVAANW